MSSEKDYSVLPEVTVIQESAKIESEEHKPKKTSSLRLCAGFNGKRGARIQFRKSKRLLHGLYLETVRLGVCRYIF